MILVDTSALYAAYVYTDRNHHKAVAWFQNNVEPLITTNFIVAEVLTLLRSRHRLAEAQDLSLRLRSNSIVIEWITESDFQEAWRICDEFADKLWSFVDCLSYVVISRLQLTTAFAFDEHFRQFGMVTVVP